MFEIILNYLYTLFALLIAMGSYALLYGIWEEDKDEKDN